MITGTLITALSVPMYWGLFHALGLTGLAIASDIGILVQTAALAILLHRKRLVSLSHLEFGELARALVAALIAYAATAAAAHLLPPVSTHPKGTPHHRPRQHRLARRRSPHPPRHRLQAPRPDPPPQIARLW